MFVSIITVKIFWHFPEPVDQFTGFFLFGLLENSAYKIQNCLKNDTFCPRSLLQSGCKGTKETAIVHKVVLWQQQRKGVMKYEKEAGRAFGSHITGTNQ